MLGGEHGAFVYACGASDFRPAAAIYFGVKVPKPPTAAAAAAATAPVPPPSLSAVGRRPSKAKMMALRSAALAEGEDPLAPGRLASEDHAAQVGMGVAEFRQQRDVQAEFDRAHHM